eukprot:6471348-Amphidinium_carterae.1
METPLQKGQTEPQEHKYLVMSSTEEMWMSPFQSRRRAVRAGLNGPCSGALACFHEHLVGQRASFSRESWTQGFLQSTYKDRPLFDRDQKCTAAPTLKFKNPKSVDV